MLPLSKRNWQNTTSFHQKVLGSFSCSSVIVYLGSDFEIFGITNHAWHAWVRDHFVGHAHPRICGGLADSAGGWFEAACFAQRWTPMIRGKRKWQVGAKQRAFQNTSPNLGPFLYLEKFNLKFINLLPCSCVSCNKKMLQTTGIPLPDWQTICIPYNATPSLAMVGVGLLGWSSLNPNII